MIERSLTYSTAKGLAWTWGALVVTTALQLIYTASISRLLEPADFGLMAAALLGLRLVTFISLFGLASAVVQKPQLGDRDISTALRLAGLLGLLTAVAVVVASPGLATVIREPGAAGVMRWMAVGVFISTIGAIPEALLRRAMRFRAFSGLSVASYAFGYLLVGLAGARSGWGVWSLVAASIAQSGFSLVVSWLLVRPRFRLRSSVTSARRLLGFSGLVSATGFLEFLQSSIDTLAVGRYAGASALGQYSRASLLVGLPIEQATTATTRVLLPGLSRVQHQAERYSHAVTTAMGLTAVIVVVPAAMIAAGAPSIVPWLLGDGWSDAAAVLPIVGIAYAVALLTNTPAVAAEARGAVRRKLAVQMCAVVTTTGLVATAVVAGPTLHRLAGAWAGGELLRHCYYWLAIFRHIGLDGKAVAVRYLFALVASFVAASPVFVVVRILDQRGFASLMAAAGLGLACTLALVMSPFGRVYRADIDGVRRRMRA